MATILLTKSSLTNISSQLKRMQSETEEAQKKVNSAIKGLDFEVASKRSIKTKMNKLNSTLSQQISLSEQYKTTFANVVNSLKETDEKFGNESRDIFDKIKEVVSDIKKNIYDFLFASKMEKYAKTSELFLKGKSILSAVGTFGWELLQKAGHLGAIFGIVSDFSKDGVKGILKGGKGVYDFFKGVIDDAKDLKKIARTGISTKQMWKERILGIRDYFKKEKITASVAKNPYTRWRNNLNKIAGTMDEFKDVKKVSKGTWFSLAFDGIINTIDNYTEHDGFSGRMVAETVVETAWDVGVTAAATATVAAAVGAVCGGAPAIVVAGGVYLVKTGLDAVTNWATGTDKGFTEVVSDGLIDFAEAAGNKLGNFLSKASDSIGAGWKKCFGF